MPTPRASLLFVLAAIPVRAADPKPVDFAHEVLPILKTHCAKCHTNGTYKGSMSLDTRADVVKKAAVPGKSAESKMIKRVTSDDADERMPPEGARLSDKEVRVLRSWIDEGLAWESGFSFKARTYVAPIRPRRPGVPPSSAGSPHPIGRILGKYFAEHKINPPQPLDDAAFARRAFLDL